MATGYTNLLGLAQPVTGELTDNWGDVLNDSVTQLLEDAIAGVSTYDVTAGHWVLDDTGGGAPNEARAAILVVTGTPNDTREVQAPERSKSYIVVNDTAQTVVVKGAGTAGAHIPPKEQVMVAWDGSDFVVIGTVGVVRLTGLDDVHNISKTGWYSWTAADVPSNVPEQVGGFLRASVIDAGNVRLDLYIQNSVDIYTAVQDNYNWSPWAKLISNNQYATTNEAKAGVLADKMMSPATTAAVFADKSVGGVKDTTAGKLLKVGSYGLGLPIELDNIDDLDGITTPGFYSQRLDGNAVEYKNYPVNRAGALVVTQHFDVFQTYLPRDNSGVYTRSYTGAAWSSWINNTAMPVGATYIQLVGQAAPADLWGGVWANLYNGEGVLLRTEGGVGHVQISAGVGPQNEVKSIRIWLRTA